MSKKKKQEKKHKTEPAEKKSDDTEEKLREMTETLQRVQAEFENYKKRVDKEQCNYAKSASQEVIRSLLPVLDDFELALKNHKKKDEFYKGIELIYSRLVEALKCQGLKRIQATGQKFDPYYHEALLTEESDKPENTVLEEMQKGYILNNKVLRTSKVKVAKAKKQGNKQKNKKHEEEEV